MLQITFLRVLTMLLFLLPGFIICKLKKAATEHLPIISAVLIYICTPCLIIGSFASIDFTIELALDMLWFFLCSLVLQILFLFIIHMVFRRRGEDGRYRVMNIASVLGNIGFFGIPMIEALLPGHPEAVCYATSYILSMNIIVFSFGVYCLTRDPAFMKPRAVLWNPTTVSFAVAIVLALCGLSRWMPDFIGDGMSLVAKMSNPLCMIILGVRLASMDIKKVFLTPFTYLSCLNKLILFPLFAYFAVYFLPLDYSFKVAMLVLSGAPCGAVILSLSELYHSESEAAADSLVLTTLCCVVTLPLLTLIVK